MQFAHEFMSRDPYTVTADMKVSDLARGLLEHGADGAVVVDGRKVVGVVTAMDLVFQEKQVHLPTFIAFMDAVLPLGTRRTEAELADMFLVEPERGCSRRCTFCVMRGETTGGMRLLDAGIPMALVPDEAKKVGLVGAAVTDHPRLEQLVSDIVDSGRGLGISSLRADRLTPELVAKLGKGGYRTITVASDGISKRMREVLQRGVKEENLLQAARYVKAGGLHKLKVYEMMGAPTETDEDADELVRFALELAKIVRLTLTFSTFVAKRNTPLDRQPFIGAKAAEARLKRIRNGLKGKVQIRPQPPKWAYVEYELAQRGVEVSEAAVEAVHAGGSYRAWCKAFEKLPPIVREPLYGDESRRARRTGFAKDRARLPLLS